MNLLIATVLTFLAGPNGLERLDAAMRVSWERHLLALSIPFFFVAAGARTAPTLQGEAASGLAVLIFLVLLLFGYPVADFDLLPLLLFCLGVTGAIVVVRRLETRHERSEAAQRSGGIE